MINVKPKTKEEIDELYSYESAICKIKFEIKKDNKILIVFKK